MPTASQRPASSRKGGASTASNETPVSTKEQPNPSAEPNTRATRPPGEATDDTVRSPEASSPAGKANGRDHPIESEHDHEHQKLKGVSAERTRQTRR